MIKLLKHLRIRSKFLLLPAMASLLIMLLGILFFAYQQSENRLLERINNQDVPKMRELSEMFSEFSTNHVKFISLLATSLRDNVGEGEFYAQGRKSIISVNRIIQALKDLEASYQLSDDQLVIFNELQTHLEVYRDQMGSTVLMSSVKLNLITEFMLRANTSYDEANSDFLAFIAAVETGAQDSFGRIQTLSERNQSQYFLILGFTLILILIISVMLAGHFADDLNSIIQRLSNLARGDTRESSAQLDRRDEFGSVDKAIEVFREALIENERQRAELHDNLEQLQDSEKRYQGLLNLIAMAIIVVDRNQRILLFNKAAEKIFGYPENEIIGEQLHRLLPADFHQQHRKYVDNFSRCDVDYVRLMTRDPVKAQRRNGDEFHAEVSLSRITLSSELLMVAAVNDVSERVRTQDELADYRGSLEETLELQGVLTSELEYKNAELERFVYTVSHELRSPLVTTKGFIELLKRDIASNNHDAIDNHIARIEDAADNMGELLEGLLELSRIGQVINPPQAGMLRDLVTRSVEPFQEKIADRGIKLEIDEAMPPYWGDPVRLQEVFQNLVENAIKFMGQQASPLIEIRAMQQGDEIICSVRDNGIGIEPQYHDRVFNLFERLNKNVEGTGIGMSLVQRIIQAHGGEIRVESAGQHKGCTFIFTLPVQEASSLAS